MPTQPPKNDTPDDVFADFMSAMDPNRAPGRGVDHQPSGPFFGGGFPFVGGWGGGWGAPNPPRPPHPPHPHMHPHPPHPPPPPGGWDNFGWWAEDDDGEHHFGHRGRHHDHHDRHYGGRFGRRDRHGGGGGGRHGHRGGGGGRWHSDNENDGTRDHPMNVGSDNEATTENEKKGADEKAASPDTMKDDFPDPDEAVPVDDERDPPPYGPGFHRGRRGGGGCRRGGRGRNNRCGQQDSAPFNFANMMRGVTGHPFFQHMSNAANQYRNGMQPTAPNNNSDDGDAFAPPVDTFNTETAYILHVSLPGAKKDDIGVNWNPDTGELTVSGVVHRPGDEAFLQKLHAAERKVGVFERKVTLPPAGVLERGDDVDAGGITAKLEDGLLVVVVPKVEKEWTEVRKVDIE